MKSFNLYYALHTVEVKKEKFYDKADGKPSSWDSTRVPKLLLLPGQDVRCPTGDKTSYPLVSLCQLHTVVTGNRSVLLSHASPAGPARAGERHRGVGFRTDGERAAEWPPLPLLRAVEASAKRPHGKSVRLRIGG